MAYERVTAHGRIGSLEIRNRITLSPMEKNWCDRLGNPTQKYIDYYAERARQGVGLINFEATYVDAAGELVSAFARNQSLIRLVCNHDVGFRHTEGMVLGTAVTW